MSSLRTHTPHRVAHRNLHIGGRESAFKVGTGSTHKRVTEAMEISAVPHFLREYVGDVACPADVRNGDGAVGDPFKCGVFLVLDVTIAFGCCL